MLPLLDPDFHLFNNNSRYFFYPTVITCKAPDKLANGGISWNSKDTPTLGYTIHYHCDKGYALNGTSAIVCQENGEYDHPPPTCHCKISECIHSTWTVQSATAHADVTELNAILFLSGNVQGTWRTGQWSKLLAWWRPESRTNHPVSLQQRLCPQRIKWNCLPRRRQIWSSAPYMWRWAHHFTHQTLTPVANVQADVNTPLFFNVNCSSLMSVLDLVFVAAVG